MSQWAPPDRTDGGSRHFSRRNPNARTTSSAHAMGLAFDISILDVPIGSAPEIRDVLRRMRDDGAVLQRGDTTARVSHNACAGVDEWAREPGRADG
jgi:hypothetical protein